jgi:integrase
MQLKEAFSYCIANRPSWREGKGTATLVININHVLSVLGDDLEVESITGATYSQLQNALLDTGKSNGTVNRITSVLSTMLTTLQKHGLIEKAVRSPQSLKEGKGRQSVYTEKQVEALIEASTWLDNVDAELFTDCLIFAAKTGCRQGEMLKLKYTDIDFGEGYLTFKDTKTDENRVLPLTPTLRELLRKRYDNRLDDEEFVFPTTKDVLIIRLRKIQKMVGIENKELCWHSLRHYAATNLFAKGAALPDVKDILGHKNTQTTMRYAKSTLEGKTRALNLID